MYETEKHNIYACGVFCNITQSLHQWKPEILFNFCPFSFDLDPSFIQIIPEHNNMMYSSFPNFWNLISDICDLLYLKCALTVRILEIYEELTCKTAYVHITCSSFRYVVSIGAI